MAKKIVYARNIKGHSIKVKAEGMEFRPSVYAVIIKNGKVLLCPNWDGYDFPGGGIEKGETIDEAFQREVWEETGLKAKRGEVLLAESDFFVGPYTDKKYHTIVMYYLAKNISGKISDKHFDKYEKIHARKAEWIDIKKVSKLKFLNALKDSPALIKKAEKIIKK